ncbi:MAG: ATP-binding protein [Myxococcota bacterium]|nr:ATP-binding protein [Myxococcota bacterium]
MSEVSCRTCGPLIEALQSAGLPLDVAVEGLPLPPETLLKPSNRITWDEYLGVLENAARALGGAGDLEETGIKYYTQAGGLLGVVASRVSSARPLYHMGARWYGPSLYSATRATTEDLPDGRIRQTIEILPTYRSSELFFRQMRGGLRAAPLLLGQPEAEVEMEISGRRATYVITPPPALTVWGRVRRALRWRRTLEKADRELTVQRDEIHHGYEMARRTGDLLSFQTRRLEAEQRERQQAEQLLLQAQKLETIGRLSGAIAHDFNNILTTILGYVDVALDRVDDDDDPLRPDLDEIRAMGERGAGLVQQLMSVSRPQPVARRRVILNEVVFGVETMLRRLLPAAVQVSVLPAPGPLEIYADPSQLEQILLNLAINARDAMPDGGRLEIAISPATADEAGAEGAAPETGYARLEVRDTGEGMDEATRTSALEPFFTTKPAGKGSGLGLASVHSIVMSANGTIQLDSELGKGTRVSLHFPIAGEDIEAR